MTATRAASTDPRAAARSLACLAAFAVTTGCAAPRPGGSAKESAGDCAQARAVLQRFLDLDAAAGREWTPELTSLITDTDGPGWDRQALVSGSRIEGCTATVNPAPAFELPVRYELLGRLGSESGSGTPRFQRAAAGETERHVFRVVRARDGLRVDGVGAIEPHIGKPRALAQLESLVKESGSPAGTSAAQDVLAALRGLP